MKKKTLCLCMIVKNESHIILETLESIRHCLDYWVVCDTGSTDNTIELVQDFFARHGIPGEIHSEKWVDFGHNRSQVFEYAYGKSDYLWVIDADDILVGSMDLTHLEADTYSLRYGTDFTYWRPQLFNGSERWIYRGVLHEFPVCVSKEDASKGMVEGEYHMASRRLGARNLIDPVTKYLGDAHILAQALQRETDPFLTTRYMFYLAQSYRDAGQPALAIQWYQRRIDAGGWAEEVWRARYEIGLLHELMEDAQTARACYLDAYEYRPARAESLYSLAKMCNVRREFFQARLFLECAAGIPLPQDVLFVSRDVYDYLICFELSICMYWLGDFERSMALSDQLISMKERISSSVFEQAVKNRAFAVDALAARRMDVQLMNGI